MLWWHHAFGVVGVCLAEGAVIEGDMRASYCFIGFGLLLGFEQGVLLSESLFLCVGLRRQPNDVFDIALLVSLALTLMIVAGLRFRPPARVVSKLPLISAALVIASLFVVVPFAGGPSVLAFAIAGAFGGIGVGIAGLMWQDALLGVRRPMRGVALGIAFVALFLASYALVALPSPSALGVAFLLPLVSGLLLMRARMTFASSRDEVAFQGAPSHPSPGTVGDGWMPGLFKRTLSSFSCLAAFVVVFGIVGQIAMNNPGGFGYASMLTTLAIGSAAIAFLCIAATLLRVINPASIYKALFPLALGVLFLLPFTGWENRVFVNMFIAGGYYFFSFAFMLLLSNLIEEHSCDSYRVNGMMRGAETALSLVGVFVGKAVARNDAYDFIQVVAIVFICVYLFAMALLVLTGQEKWQAASRIGAPSQVVVVKQVVVGSGDQVDARCDACARKFLLTKREEEVLAYLVRGRSSVYISKDLVLSLNTVKGHVKNIYAKTGVHSKQDLIDLVERG